MRPYIFWYNVPVDKCESQTIKVLQKAYPNAKTALNFKTPLELLIATILSAQCTDKRVNIVTGSLFKKYKTVKDYASVNLKAFQKEISSINFYNNKAKNIINSAKIIIKDFQGKVPDSMEELIKLPGVGRKTATVVLYNAFNKISGITVDTHVMRVSQRLGFTSHTTPEKIEMDLMEIFPKQLWGKLSHLLIYHGRSICIARKPKCPKCPLKKSCPSYPIFMKKFYFSHPA